MKHVLPWMWGHSPGQPKTSQEPVRGVKPAADRLWPYGSKPRIRFGILSSVIVYAFAVFLLPLLTLGLHGTAYASSGEQYLFYYDPSDASAIEQAFSSNPLGNSGFEDNFDKTSIYAMDSSKGFFGSTPVGFAYNQSASSLTGGNGSGLGGLGGSTGSSVILDYDSTKTFTCTVNKLPSSAGPWSLDLTAPYTLSFPLSMTAYPTAANIKNNQPVAAQLSLDPGSVSITSAASVKSHLTDSQSLWYGANSSSSISMNDVLNEATQNNSGQSSKPGAGTIIPSNCLPSGLSLSTDQTNRLSLSNYAGLSKSDQKKWPGLQDSVDLLNTENAANNPSTPSGNASQAALGCQVNFTPSINPINDIQNGINWLLCSLVQGMVGVIQWLDNQITGQLAIGTTSTKTDQPNNIFAGSSGCAPHGGCDEYYAAWASFRDLALGLMVVAGLVVVISQALGMELLDAYTIRKVLPRLLVAAVAIALSWQIMEFLVTVSNDLGYGVPQLIKAPFANQNQASLSLNFGTALGSTILGAVGFAIYGLFGILLLAGTGLLALFTAYVVIVLRQVVVIMMVIVAPIGLIAYILPNTQRIYKLWWDTLIKALLMFPLISAIIAAGYVFAWVTLQQGGGTGSSSTGYDVIAFVAYFAPFFLIPSTFRLAGAAVSGIGNFVNGRAQGGFNMLRQGRSNAAKKNLQDLKAGTRFEGKRWIPGSITAAEKANELTSGVGLGWKGRYGFGERGALARAQHEQTTGAEIGKTHGMQAIKGKNDYNRIVAMANGDERRGRDALYRHLMTERGDDGKPLYTHEQAMARVNTAAKAAHAAGAFTRPHAIAAAYNLARDGTAIRDTDDLANIAAIIGNGDNNNTLTYAAEFASISRQVGRSDLAAATEPIAALAYAYSDTMYNKGLFHKDKNKALEALPGLSAAAWESGAGGEVAHTEMSNAKGRTVRNNTRRAVNILKAHRAAVEAGTASPYTPQQVQFAAASLVDKQQAIDANFGRLNNRQDALKEMGRDEGALQWYLDTPATVVESELAGYDPSTKLPVYKSGPKGNATNRDIVGKIVRDRHSMLGDLSPEDRLAEMRRMELEDES